MEILASPMIAGPVPSVGGKEAADPPSADNTKGSRQAAKEIKCFTGLRGCAAVLVMLYHLTLNMPPDTMPFQSFLLNGYLWVDLFFLLSGFVMAYSQARFFAAGYELRPHLRFLISRLARIYPLYALVIVESAMVSVWRGDVSNLMNFGRTLVLNLTLVQAWGLAASLEGAAWSISTEWGAYLLFPVLLGSVVCSPRWLMVLSAGLASAAIVFLASTQAILGFDGQSRSGPLDIYSAATIAPLLRCVAEFTLGLLAFRVWQGMADAGEAWTGTCATLVSVALLVGMSLKGFDVVIVVLFVVLLVSLAPQAGPVSKILSMRVPYLLGQWSYSIYLIHDKFSHPAGILQKKLESGHVPLASLLTAIIVCCTVVLLGAISFNFIERPMRRWLTRIPHRVGANGHLAQAPL